MRKLKISLMVIFTCIVWLGLSAYGGLSGWWMSPVAPEKDIQAFVKSAKKQLQQEHIGDAAFILLKSNFVISEHYDIAKNPVNANTLFPMASMSKLFTAVGIHRLVDEQRLELDKAIAPELSRWHLPQSERAQSITIRQLLSHTSGLNDGLGFGDYHAQEKIPTLEDSLTQPRTSSGKKAIIAVGDKPLGEFQYSGGGYLLAELIVEEVAQMPFKQWMQQSIFSPLAMDRTTYSYLGEQENVAVPYSLDGKRAPHYKYASNAATGLSSTPADLVRFTQMLISLSQQNSDLISLSSFHALTKPTGYKMGAAIWGAGAMLFAPSNGQQFVFGHDGANDPAINTALRINPSNGDAIIVLVTGHPSIASKIASQWTFWQTGTPDILSVNQAIESAFIPAGIGCIVIIAFAIAMQRRKSVKN